MAASFRHVTSSLAGLTLAHVLAAGAAEPATPPAFGPLTLRGIVSGKNGHLALLEGPSGSYRASLGQRFADGEVSQIDANSIALRELAMAPGYTPIDGALTTPWPWLKKALPPGRFEETHPVTPDGARSGPLVTFVSRDRPLLEAMRELASLGGRRLELVSPVSGQANVTARQVPWSLVVRQLGQANDFDWIDDGRALRVAPSQKLVAKASELAARGFTGHPISLDFVDGDRDDVLRLFADISGLNVVAPPSLGRLRGIRVVETPWDQVLEVVLESAGLTWQVQDNVLLVFRANEMAAPSSCEPFDVKSCPDLAAAPVVSLDLVDARADAVLGLFADLAGLRLQFAGGAPERRVTLKLLEVPWFRAMQYVARRASLEVVPSGGVVRVLPDTAPGARPRTPKETDAREAALETARRAFVSAEGAPPRALASAESLEVAAVLDAASERALLTAALAARERQLGTESPQLITLLSRLAPLMLADGDRESARRLLERAIALRGGEPPGMAAAKDLRALISLLSDAREYEATLPLVEKLMAALQAQPPYDGFDRLEVMYLENSDNLPGALAASRFRERRLRARREKDASAWYEWLGTLREVASLTRRREGPDAARAFLREATAEVASRFGRAHILSLWTRAKEADLVTTEQLGSDAAALRDEVVAALRTSSDADLGEAAAERLHLIAGALAADKAAQRLCLSRAVGLFEAAGADASNGPYLQALSELADATGDRAARRGVREKLLRLREQAGSPPHEVVPVLLALADDLDPAQQRERRLGLRERALALAMTSEWWWQQADALSATVDSRIAAGDAQGARALVSGWAQRAGAKSGQKVDEWFPSLHRAAAALASRDPTAATTVCEQILAAFQAAPDSAPLKQLGQLGETAREAGALAVARAALELARTRAVAQLASGGWSPELDPVADLALALDDYALAEQLRRAALDASEKRADAAGSVESRRLLAEVLAKASRHDEARALYEQVFASREVTHGPDSAVAAHAAAVVGQCFWSTERWTEALPWYEKAAAAWGKANGPESLEHVWGLEHVAFVKNKLGDPAAALSLYERALAIRLAAAKGGKDTVLEARIFEDALVWPDSAVVSRVASLLREQLEQRPVLAHRALYRSLWKAEARIAASNQLPDLRRRLAADVERIRAAKKEDDSGSWLMLESAYETLGDEANAHAMSAEIARRFPCEIGAWHRTSNWRREHPEPKADSGDRGAWVAAHLAATAAWVAECPDELSYSAERLAAVRASAKPPVADVEAAADGLLRAWRRVAWATPLSAVWQVADAYVEARTRLGEVPRLASEALAESERAFQKDTSVKTQHEHNQIRRCTLVAEALVRSGDADSAAKTLSELKGIIEANGHDEWWGHSLHLLGLVQAARGHRTQAAVLYSRALARGDETTKEDLDGLTAADSSLAAVTTPEGAARAWSSDGGDAQMLAWVEALPGVKRETNAPEWKEQSRPLPELRLRDTSGREWREKDLRGAFTVVSVWATWCQPCVTELPHLQKLHERRLAGKRGPRVVTINVDANPLLVEPFLKRHGLKFPVLLQGASAGFETFAPDGIPTTLIVDPGGTVRRQRVGFGANEKDVVENILGELRALGAPLPLSSAR